MSQDGALGFAEHGYSYAAILAHYYTGTALGKAPPRWKVRVLVGGKVRKVPLETYIRGVVANEMSPSWPLAALEAQAIASRTYALTAHSGNGAFDVYSDTRSQVYRGRSSETPQSNLAVKATAGQIVTYAGQPAITYFFASSGGMTESIQYGFPGSAPSLGCAPCPILSMWGRCTAGARVSGLAPPRGPCTGWCEGPFAVWKCSGGGTHLGSSPLLCLGPRAPLW